MVVRKHGGGSGFGSGSGVGSGAKPIGGGMYGSFTSPADIAAY